MWTILLTIAQLLWSSPGLSEAISEERREEREEARGEEKGEEREEEKGEEKGEDEISPSILSPIEAEGMMTRTVNCANLHFSFARNRPSKAEINLFKTLLKRCEL